MTRQEVNLPELALTFIALSILTIFFSISIFIPTSNDLLLTYGQKIGSTIPMDDWIFTQMSSQHLIPAAIGYLIQFWGYDYFHLTGFWIMSFALALWFCTREFIHYIKLPPHLIPWVILALGFHGFWAELMESIQAYLNYSLGLFASGMALLGAQRFVQKPFFGVGFIAFWIWITLTSYEPMALIPLFAISLVFIRDFFDTPTAQEQRSLKDVAPLIIGFFCGELLFLISYNFTVQSSYPLSLSWEVFFQKSGLYLVDLPALFLSITPLILPLHERLIYGLAYIGIGIVLIQASSSKTQRLALSGLLLSLLLSADPMRIFIPSPHVITTGTMVSSVFFHVGLMFIFALVVVNYLKQKYSQWPHKELFFGTIFMVICLSGSNQLSIVHERIRQYAHDEIMASNLLVDFKKEGLLYEGSRIAVISPPFYRKTQLSGIPFMPFPISTFWSNLSTGTAMLSRASGITLKTVPYDDLWSIAQVSKMSRDADLQLYQALCSNLSMPWEIRRKTHVTIVCLAPKEKDYDHHASSS